MAALILGGLIGVNLRFQPVRLSLLACIERRQIQPCPRHSVCQYGAFCPFLTRPDDAGHLIHKGPARLVAHFTSQNAEAR